MEVFGCILSFDKRFYESCNVSIINILLKLDKIKLHILLKTYYFYEKQDIDVFEYLRNLFI